MSISIQCCTKGVFLALLCPVIPLLVGVIIGCSRIKPTLTPFAVASYITAAYWFTSSTSFANPAVTRARAASNAFEGIRPVDAPGFIVAQLFGGAAATLLFCWHYPAVPVHATVAGTISPSDFGKGSGSI